MPAPTLSTATMVFAPGLNLRRVLVVHQLRAEQQQLAARSWSASFLVATTEPSTLARNIGVMRDA